jgi:hypothetical protein
VSCASENHIELMRVAGEKRAHFLHDSYCARGIFTHVGQTTAPYYNGLLSWETPDFWVLMSKRDAA